MNLKNWMFILLMVFVLAGCTEANKFANIEAENHFDWQKYMDEEEFNQVQAGMTYMEVVEIAKGRGEQLDENTYVWPDEVVLTHAYEIKFAEGQVTEKHKVERRGASLRDREEKAPAEPGVPAEGTQTPAEQEAPATDESQ